MAELLTSPTNESWNDPNDPNQSRGSGALKEILSRLFSKDYLAQRRGMLAREETDTSFEGRYVAGQLLGLMEANMNSLALRSSEPEAEGIVQAMAASPRLGKRYFLPARDIASVADWDGNMVVIQAFEDDTSIELPLANFVSADCMVDWSMGRGDAVKVEEGTGISRTSRKTIEEYKSRKTEAPPIESVVGYVQPSGTVLFVAAQGSHRTAAAVARNDETIKTTNLTLVQLRQDILV